MEIKKILTDALPKLKMTSALLTGKFCTQPADPIACKKRTGP